MIRKSSHNSHYTNKNRQLEDLSNCYSDRLVGGDDLTAFGYAWAHSEPDPTLAMRMYLKICRYLLTRLETYDSEGRRRAIGFLCDGRAGEPLAEYSRNAVEKRLSRIEVKLRRKEPSSGSPKWRHNGDKRV